MPADESATTTTTTTGYKTLRITSSTTIRVAVSSCLAHLNLGHSVSGGPIVLHTHPVASTSASTSTSILSRSNSSKDKNNKDRAKRTAHAALGKAISVVEIVKREFEGYQRASWRAEAEERRKANRNKKLGLADEGNGNGKGKKRARDEEQEQVSDKNGQEKQAKKALMRIYQYNELDCLDNLDGVASDVNPSEEQENEDPETGNTVAAITGNTSDATTAAQAAAEAADRLDQAILNQVVHNRRRPRKSHVPVIRITLSTVRLLALEASLKKAGKQWTLQYPPKTKRTRTRKSNGSNKKQRAEGDVNGEEHDEGEEDQQQEEEEGADKKAENTTMEIDEGGTHEAGSTHATEGQRQIRLDDASTIAPSSNTMSTDAMIPNDHPASTETVLSTPKAIDANSSDKDGSAANPQKAQSDSQATETSNSTTAAEPMLTAPEAMQEAD